jgi:hypothetical protein
VKVTPEDRCRLEAIIGDRNAPQKHVWRTKIHGLTNSDILRLLERAKQRAKWKQ